MLEQLLGSDIRVVDHRDRRVDHLAEVVRRDVRRHADRDAGRAVHEQVREARRQDGWLALLAVVVRDELDGLFVDVAEQLHRERREAALGVPLCGRLVAVDRTEIPAPVDQRRAHREVLGHAREGVVHRVGRVGMVLTDHVTDDARRLAVRACRA